MSGKRNATFGKMRIYPDHALALIVGGQNVKKGVSPSEISKLVWDYVRQHELIFSGGKKIKFDAAAVHKARLERRKAEEKRRISKERKKAAKERVEKLLYQGFVNFREKVGENSKEGKKITAILKQARKS